MAATICDGPNVTTGNTNPQQDIAGGGGPDVIFQGAATLDPRWNTSIGQALGFGKIYSVLENPYSIVANWIPIALSNTRLFPATVGAPGTLVLNGQGIGVTPNLPILPLTKVAGVTNASGSTEFQTNSVYTSAAPVLGNQVLVTALDAGFGYCTTTSGSATVTLIQEPGYQAASVERDFYPGQQIWIGGAGAASGQVPLFCSVVSVSGLSLTISTPALASVSNTQVGTADLSGQGNVAGTVGFYAWPFYKAGVVAVLDPKQTTARAINATGTAAGQNGCTLTISGFDVYGAPMSEVITLTGAATVAGKKAWKYISSIVAANGTGTLSTGNVSVGTTDVYGFPYKQDLWEFLDIWVNATYITANTGFVQAVITNPATSVTGDVRGTYALQSASTGNGAGAGLRVVVAQTLEHINLFGSNNINFQQLYGVAQT
jgi:hypothetical protein